MVQLSVSAKGLLEKDGGSSANTSMGYLAKALMFDRLETVLKRQDRLSKQEYDMFERLNTFFGTLMKGAKMRLAELQGNSRENWVQIFDSNAYREFERYSTAVRGADNATWGTEPLYTLLLELNELRYETERVLTLGRTNTVKIDKLTSFTTGMRVLYHKTMQRKSFDEMDSGIW